MFKCDCLVKNCGISFVFIDNQFVRFGIPLSSIQIVVV